MKNMMTAGAEMSGIIVMEMMISHVFAPKIGKAFSRAAFLALFLHYGFKFVEGKIDAFLAKH